MTQKGGIPRWEVWARFRYGVVAGLLASPVESGRLQEALQALSEKTYVHPTKAGATVTFGKSSIERWYYIARKADDPIGALGRKVRSDAGSYRVMPGSLLEALGQQYQGHKRWSYQLHRDNLAALLEERPALGPLPSYATLVRRMKERGWIPTRCGARNPTEGQKQAAERLESREVRSYEREHVHALWHSDGHQGSRKVLDARGVYQRVVMIAVLDDYSRLCCHGQWYYGEDAESLIHTFCQAAAKRGLCRDFMTDRGGAMMAQETQNGLARLGVRHCPTLPHSPYQNGKMEEFWSQVEGRLLPMLEDVRPLSLEYLNRATQAWLECEYNQKPHEALGCSPLQRVLEGHSVARGAPDTESMRYAFCVQERRIQRRSDGTVSIKGVAFEVPSQYRYRHHIYVKYRSFDLSQAFVVEERSGEVECRILPMDRQANAGHPRRTHVELDKPIPQLPLGGEPGAPLMRSLLRRYEGMGLPPAYVPLEQRPTGARGMREEGDE